MKALLVILFGLILQNQAKVHIDVSELKCLVCRETLNELDSAIKQIDPTKRVEVGSYRLDAKGNANHKMVLQSKSEIYLSELADKICDKMDDYVRATWKHNGKLTLLQLITADGKMNADMSSVDIIQDDDLNKSLKYYCEGIIEEYEENIIGHYKNDSDNIREKVCSVEAKLCPLAEQEEEEDYLKEEL